LGELAKANLIELEVCLYGGTAMMLAFDRRAMTRDVDAVFHPRDTASSWIAQVAEEQRLPEDWLNDDVRQFLVPVGSHRRLPMDLPGLRVTVPTTSYLLAMKALAGRRALPGYKGDEEDLRFLIRKLGIQSVDEVQEHIDRFYPDDRPSDSAHALLARIIQEETGK
jgi:hypothetical protein